MSRASRRRPIALLAVLVLLAIAIPATLVASHQFPDVPDSNPFHADIDALVDSGVTSGCGGGNYCPSGNVTREQMAAFLNRLGALAPGKTPVVNADKLDGKDSTDFVTVGDLVEGYGPGAYRLSTALAGTFTTGYDLGGFNVQRSDAGDARVVADPRTPRAQNGVAYRLESVTYCASSLSATSKIDSVAVFAYNTDGVNSLAFAASDATDRQADGCFTASFIGSSVAADLVEFVVTPSFTAGGDAVSLGGLSFTWAPVTP